MNKRRAAARSSGPLQRVKKVVIPSQCAHWRGNPLDDRNIFDLENIGFPKIWGIATPACGLVRDDGRFFDSLRRAAASCSGPLGLGMNYELQITNYKLQMIQLGSAAVGAKRPLHLRAKCRLHALRYDRHWRSLIF